MLTPADVAILEVMAPHRPVGVEGWPLPHEHRQHGRGQWCALKRDRLWLGDVYAALGWTVGAEIGVQRGHHALVMCQRVPNLHLFCVDPYSSFGGPGQTRMEHHFAAAQARLTPYHATFLRKTSLEALADIPDRSLDFVYIDGDHRFDYVVRDIIEWAAKVKEGGIVACHDYANWYEVGVLQAVDAYTFCHDIQQKYVTFEPAPTAFWVNP